MKWIFSVVKTAAMIFILALFLTPENVWAAEAMNDEDALTIDYSEIEKALKNMTGEDSDISFSEIVGELMAGRVNDSLKSFLTFIFHKIFKEIHLNWNMMFRLMGIGVLGAVFASFSAAFAKKYVADTGFYLTYMIVFVLLASSFASASAIAVSVVDRLIELMKAIIPAFGTAVVFALGVTTGNAWYQLLMMLVVAVDWVMARFMMRFIKIYVVLSMVNQMPGEDYFSKMAELFQTVISWTLKTILGVTLGLNIIQGMVLPAFDSVKNGWLTKLSAAVPGVGDAFGAAAKAAIGSGVLLKNAVGTAGVIVICVTCAIPLIQLLLIVVMYKLTEAVMQPVSDARLVACVHVSGEGVLMLLKSCGTVILLFIISLAMMTSASNIGLSV